MSCSRASVHQSCCVYQGRNCLQSGQYRSCGFQKSDFQGRQFEIPSLLEEFLDLKALSYRCPLHILRLVNLIHKRSERWVGTFIFLLKESDFLDHVNTRANASSLGREGAYSLRNRGLEILWCSQLPGVESRLLAFPR